MTDSLETIFEHQAKFAREIEEKGRFPKEQDQKISALCTAIIHEAVELQRLTNWKWWKQPVQCNQQLGKEELIDILHFTIHAAIVLDMTHETFLYEYLKKMQINKDRQEQGY